MNIIKQLARRALGPRALFTAEAVSFAGAVRKPPVLAADPSVPGQATPAAVSHVPSDFPPADADPEAPAETPRRALPAGLMDQPPLRDFLDGNHFGLGRHNGSIFRTADARARGVRALVAEFQAIVLALGERKQVQIDRLNDAMLQANGVCELTAQRLIAAAQRCEREKATLQAQWDLASQGQGWVQQATARYELGFAQGLQAAMDAEHLGF
jgi:hypothetical protein